MEWERVVAGTFWSGGSCLRRMGCGEGGWTQLKCQRKKFEIITTLGHILGRK